MLFSLLQLQWKSDIEGAVELIKKALEIDNKCEFAFETLGTIEVQRYELWRFSIIDFQLLWSDQIKSCLYCVIHYLKKNLMIEFCTQSFALINLMQLTLRPDTFKSAIVCNIFRGNLKEAVDLFNKAISLARTEMELSHLYSLQDAAIAQSRVATKFGISVPTAGMGQM